MTAFHFFFSFIVRFADLLPLLVATLVILPSLLGQGNGDSFTLEAMHLLSDTPPDHSLQE